MPDEELSDEDLFNEAISDEHPVEAPVVVEAEADQHRDEQGRFAKADETEEVIADPEKPVVDDNAPQVPSWRVREINDEKRALAERVSALEAERSAWQRQQPRAEPEKAAKPDPLLDPDGYEKYIESRIEDKLLNDRREFSLQSAHKTYKGEFEEAYKAAQQNIDPALKARMQQSRDPGETLIEWHREQKTYREVGNDPNAWLEKKLEERLKDPAFLAKAVAQARESAQQPQRDDRPRVDLPPSLNGASRNNAMLRSGGDISDRDLWNEVTGNG